MPKFRSSKRLVKKLEKSEKSNIVYKMNAGSAQENVKHDMSLIAELNSLVMPSYSKELGLTHRNSDL